MRCDGVPWKSIRLAGGSCPPWKDVSAEHFSPHPTHLVQTRGWIGSGYNDYGYSFVRALNIGGMIWEGLEHYSMLDKALQALECALGEWRRAQGFT
jgi:hypothetical protein